MKESIKLENMDSYFFKDEHIPYILELEKKSRIVGTYDKKKFSRFIRKAYLDIQNSFSGRTRVILQIVASVPNMKILFLPENSGVLKCNPYIKHEYLVEKKSIEGNETILIGSKNYDDPTNYRKFLGVVIHEFSHFAINETFGNNMKPFYEGDKENEKIIRYAIDEYKGTRCSKPFSQLKKMYEFYPESDWVNEIVVNIPQIFVEHNFENDRLKEFEDVFLNLKNLYLTLIDSQFNDEVKKIEALRKVNDKSILIDDNSSFYIDSLNDLVAINFDDRQQTIKTNQTYLVMKNIFRMFYETNNFHSNFMLIEVDFLENDENFELIKIALQCRKVTKLVIDGDSELFMNPCVRENLLLLLKSDHIGRIVLVLHTRQDYKHIDKVRNIDFCASNLSEKFRRSLKVNFQGSKLVLTDLLDTNVLIENIKLYDRLSEKEISIGNQLALEILEHEVKLELYDRKSSNWIPLKSNKNSEKYIFQRIRFVIFKFESEKIHTMKLIKVLRQLKTAFRSHWIVYINITDHIDTLSKMPLDSLEYLKSISIEVLKITSIEQIFFLEFAKKGKLIFVFDNWFENLHKRIRGVLLELRKTNQVCILTTASSIKHMVHNEYELVRVKSDDYDPSSVNENKTLSLKCESLKRKLCEDFESNEKNFDDYHKRDSDDSFDILKELSRFFVRAFSQRSKAQFHADNVRQILFYVLGTILFHQKNYSDSLTKYEIVSKMSTSKSIGLRKIILCDIAYCYMKLKNFSKSIDCFDEAFTLESNNQKALEGKVKALNKWGSFLYDQKQYAEAIEKFQRAYQFCFYDTSRSKTKYLLNMAQSYRKMEEYAEALNLLDQALLLDPHFDHALSEKVKTLNQWGDCLCDQKEFLKAIEKFQQINHLVLKTEKDLRKLNIVKEAVCHRKLGNYTAALQLIDDALEVDDKYKKALNEKVQTLEEWGKELYNQKSYQESIEKFEQAYQLCSIDEVDKQKNQLLKLALCNRKMKKFLQALNLLEQAIRLDPEYSEATEERVRTFQKWGNFFLYQKNYEEAIERYQNAQQYHFDDSTRKFSLLDVALCYRRMKRYEESIDLIDQALSLDSPDNKTQSDKAEVEIELRNEGVLKHKKAYDSASSSQNGIKKKSKFENVICEIMKRNYSRTIELFDKSLEIDANYQSVGNDKSSSFKDGNYREDYKMFTKAFQEGSIEIEKFKRIYQLYSGLIFESDEKLLGLPSQKSLPQCIKRIDCVEVILKLISKLDEAENERFEILSQYESLMIEKLSIGGEDADLKRRLEESESERDSLIQLVDLSNNLVVNYENLIVSYRKQLEKLVKELNQAKSK